MLGDPVLVRSRRGLSNSRTKSAGAASRVAGLGLLALGVLVMDSGGCGLSTEGASGACIDDLDCADSNPCNVETCGDDKKCTATPVPDGPALNQIPGDCQQTTCEAGEAIQSEDETDKDDGNPCTADSCNGGVPEHDEASLEDQACLMNGVCHGGKCVIICTNDELCDDGMPCTIDSCDLSTQECFYQGNHGAPVENLDATDCVQVVCNDKVEAVVADDGEVPDDMNVCTADRCENGAKIHDPLEGNPCAAGVCNADGMCVGCNSPNDCEGTDNDCQHRTCVGEICGTAKEPEGTPTNNQQSGNCKLEVCDGNGGTYQAQDSGDLPADNGVDCTAPACNGSEPGFVACCQGNACNDMGGKVCNGTGLCVDCNGPGDCSDPGACSDATCSGNVCGVSNYGAGTPANPQSGCPPSAQSTCGLNGNCNGNGQCAVWANGTVCQGPMCSGNQQTAARTCNGSGSCNQGGATMQCYPYTCGASACKTNCAGDGDCQSPNTCSGGVCKFPNGTGCSGGGQCHSNMCVDGHCCASSSCAECQECGSSGTCTNVSSGQDDDDSCTGNNQSCDGSGDCELENGQSCSSGGDCLSGNCVDSFCCDQPCGGPCRACSAAKTDAGNGVCANVSACTDPDGDCPGSGGMDECQSNGTCGNGC